MIQSKYEYQWLEIDQSISKEASLFDFYVFALVAVHLDIAGLENASAVNGVESLSHEFIVELHFADLFGVTFRNVFFEFVDTFPQFLALAHSASQSLGLLLFLLDLLGFDPLHYLFFLLLEFLLDFLDVMQLLPEFLILGSGARFKLGGSFLFIAVANFNNGQFFRCFDFWDKRQHLFIVDDSVLQFLDIAFSGVVGVTGFRCNDGWDFCWPVFMFLGVWSGPRVLQSIKCRFSGYSVIVFGFGQRLPFVFESVGIQRWTQVEVIVLDFELRSEFLSDFLIVRTSSGLQKF